MMFTTAIVPLLYLIRTTRFPESSQGNKNGADMIYCRQVV